MTPPRTEQLRFVQEVYKEWQEIDGDREDAEAANYEMIIEATKKSEIEWKELQSNRQTQNVQWS